MLTTLFPAVLRMSVTGAVTVLVVLLARLCLKRAPKIFSYALWVLVLLRLLCPTALASPVSVWNLLQTPEVETVVGEMTPATVTPLPTLQTVRPAEPAQWDGDTAYASAETPVPAARAVTPAEVLPWVWLSGALALLLYSLWKLLRLRRKLVGAVRLEGNVYLADGIEMPFVMGLFRPKIYLPFSLRGPERDYILLHERCHIRRGDHAVKLLAFLTLCLHWFNPLVWLAFLLSGQDMEMCCDEAVLKQLGVDIRADYSASLLRLATGRRVIAGVPLAFGEGDPGRRIKNVLNYKKPAFWLVIVAVIAVIVLAVCLLTDPVDRQAEPASETTPPPEQTEGILSDVPLRWFDAARQEDGPRVTAMDSPHWPWPLYRDDGDTRIYALEDGVERTVMEGMPIQSAWLLDLTGDGAPEVCATVRWDAGIVDEHIVVYDYVEDETYTLWERGLYDYTLEEEKDAPAADAPLLVWDGSWYIQTALELCASRTWTEQGWVLADGLPLEQLLETNAASLPAVTCSDQLAFAIGDGVTPMQLTVFREDLTCLEDFVLTDQPGAGEGFGQLEPGTYYVVNKVRVPGNYIKAAGDSEYTIYWCLFRLTVE